MTDYRLWYRSSGQDMHQDFSTLLEALCFAHGLLELGFGTPLEVRDRQSGELIDDLNFALS